MGSAYDGFIELDHPIRCEEKDALVVFQLSEKNGHEAIVVVVVGRTLFHKCVCLIQKKHGIEVLGNGENGFKLLLKGI